MKDIRDQAESGSNWDLFIDSIQRLVIEFRRL